MTAVAALCSATSAMAQGYSYYEDTQFDPFQRQMYKVGAVKQHPALRSYRLDELRRDYDLDSLIYDGLKKPQKKMNIWRNFLWDDLLSWRDDDVYVAINPMMDLEIGKDGDLNTYINQRGFYVNGNLGKNFWFYLDLTENQAVFPEYVIKKTPYVIPGQSNYRAWLGDPDWECATGYIAFNLGKYIDVQIGKTKTFIGDGHRSLFLSDAAAAYPMIKFNFTFLNVKYMMMMAQLRTHDAQGVGNNGYRNKYSFTHYLDWNISPRFNVGFFENVTMAAWRKTGESRSPDWGYCLPLAIFRPEEFNAGSPDKMIVGLSMRITATDWLTMYGQLMLNEFQFKDLKEHNGYWKNKYGYLAGLRIFNLFGADGLDFQGEYSHARPYSYSQYDGMATYAHHKEPLAHPLGANFHEGFFQLKYRHKRLALKTQLNIAEYGADIKGDTCSYGQNINLPSTKHNVDYGVRTLQGDRTKLTYFDASASFIINPRNMMNVAVGYRMRNTKSERAADTESSHFFFALRWSIKERIFDF